MAGDTASEILAGILGIDQDDAKRRLDRFSAALTAELLDRGRLSVDGLGQFSVIHKETVRESTPDGTRYLPPRKTVLFDHRPQVQGESATIAARRLDMEAAEAKSFAQSLSRTVAEIGRKQGELLLRGFGSLTMSSGKFRFQPDTSLEELLNIAYGGLSSIDIRQSPQVGEARPSSRKPEWMKRGVVLIVLLSLSVGGWILYRQFAPTESGVPNSAPSVGTVAPGKVLPPEKAVLSGMNASHPAQADSVLLLRGRYTVVAATFSTRKVARQELRRLTGLGHRVRIWPVRQDGVRYYRLVLGNFGSFREARDSMKVMPGGLYGNIYIQQAPKNVFIYGEKGL